MSAPSIFHQAIYLTGATASGKTAVGVALAQRLGAEVLAMDSVTLYRGMDIGSAKPTMAERGGVPHHLIDLLDPWESASVAQYLEWARIAVMDVINRGRVPLFVGGTALYLKALLRGLFDGPSANLELRQELEALADRDGPQALHERLARIDPPTALRLHPNDRRRVIRAIEVCSVVGRPLSELQKEHDQPAPSHVKVIALTRPREVMHQRINRRVEMMFEDGLVEEVRSLAARGIHSIPAQGVGYREVLEMLGGRLTLEQAVEQTQLRTRQFAKRQETWFRGLAEVRLVPIQDQESAELVADRLAAGVLALSK